MTLPVDPNATSPDWRIDPELPALVRCRGGDRCIPVDRGERVVAGLPGGSGSPVASAARNIRWSSA